MQRIAALLLGLALTAGGIHTALAQTRELGASGEMLDGIAALVNDGIVLKSEVQNRIPVAADNFVRQQQQLPPELRRPLPSASVFEQAVLDQLILEEIQYQRAKRIGIEIGDDDVNRYMTEDARSVGTTLDGFPAFLESQGIDYGEYREQHRRNLTIMVLERADVVQRISINPRELEQCLQQARESQADEYEYNISHLLISIPSNPTPQELADAEQRIREVERALDDGEDFAELAVRYSNSQTALEGGSLGWRKGAALPTFFADEIRRLEPGDITPTIRETSGFHIFRLNDMRGTEPLMEDQIRARHILLNPNEVLDDEATRQRLLGIREQLLEGGDFGTIAAAISEDAVSSIDGGDLDWRPLEDFDPVFAAQIAELEIGELTEPFRSDFGWHLAEVTGRRTFDMTENLRERNCEDQIRERKITEELDIWRSRLIEDAYVLRRL